MSSSLKLNFDEFLLSDECTLGQSIFSTVYNVYYTYSINKHSPIYTHVQYVLRTNFQFKKNNI